ncbi:MAG: AbrB family transcriptional regulator, partial [Halopseudomonas sp.]
SVAGVLGADCRIPNRLRDACFIVIGLTLGSSVTPEVLSAAAAWPVSIVGMCISVGLVMLSGGLMFHHLFGMDRKTALLASSPGHLSYVISFSADIGAGTAIISVIQSMRVLFLTLAVPVAVAILTDADMTMRAPVGQVLPLTYLAALALLSAIFGAVLIKLKVPAAFLISGMIISSIGHGTNMTQGAVTPEISTAAFTIMGTLIGTCFSGVTLNALRKAAFGGIVLTLVGLTISICAAALISYSTGLPLIDAIIAFAPGGLETMVAMGAVVGADPAYVAIHHVARLFFLSAFVPLVLPRSRAGE